MATKENDRDGRYHVEGQERNKPWLTPVDLQGGRSGRKEEEREQGGKEGRVDEGGRTIEWTRREGRREGLGRYKHGGKIS